MLVKKLGLVDYVATYAAMQEFTTARASTAKSGVTPDELWLCEHPPVFTQGLAGKPEHVMGAGDIPIIQTNRGGQVTYHGPGQVVAYPLIDLKRAGYFVKEYVHKLEEAAIRTLAHFGLTGHRVRGAPGIYVRIDNPQSHVSIGLPEGGTDAQINQFFRQHQLGKVAALGIKVSRHYTYHGVALNVAMDLEPFNRINPCGYAGLQTVDMAGLGVQADFKDVNHIFAKQLSTWLAK
jgi:lipoyl(octanoyl) transferase